MNADMFFGKCVKEAKEESDSPTTNQGDSSETNSDLDLSNPYSKMSCLILYIYSMELGSPPLYYEINRVIRDNDQTYLESLGPYIRALEVVTSWSEKHRDAHDKIETGKMIAERKGPKLDHEMLSVRGNEETFLGSTKGSVNINI